MKKRLLSIVLTLVTIVTLVPAAAFAAVTDVPGGYTKVEYIESEGSSHIDTEWASSGATGSYAYEIEYAASAQMQAANKVLCGSNGSSTRAGCINFRSAGHSSVAFGSTTGQNAKSRWTTTTDKTKVKIEVNLTSNTWNILKDGAALAEYSTGSISGKPVNSNTMYVFRNNNGSGGDYDSIAKVYSLKIWQDGVLVRDFVPCIENSTGTAGLYDLVNGKFHAAAGSAQIYGPEGAPETTVKFTTPSDVELTVSKGFAVGYAEQEVDGKTMTVMAKTSAVTEGNITTHTYTLPIGNYRFLSMSKDGPDNDKYYNWDKNFIVTYSDVLSGGKTIDADPGLLASAPGEIEWEQKRYNPAYFVRQFTDEVLARPESNVSDELKAKYPLVFTTPTYTNTDKARHQYTTQSELETFLATLDAANDEMYTYAMNKTDEGRNLMAAIFTLSDISGKTLAEAAEIVKANGKPTVQVSAQVHGDEQSGTEGALATIAMLCGEYGESVLGSVNVIIMPRMNPDGSKIYKYESGSNHRSVTRDHMSVTRVETRTMIGMYNLFEPEVVLDQHEFRPATQNTTGAMPDIKICETHNLNLPQQLVALEAEFVANQVEKGTEEGFRVDFYRDGVIETSPAATKDYYALRGSISILHEIPGQRKGRQQWERRTMAHFLAIKNTIDFTAANAERVNETVAKTKADIAKMGKVYDESALITLLHAKGTTFDINRPSFNFSDGSYVNKDNVASISKFDKAVVTRPRPTSYVIPKDTAKIAEILDVVSVHGIKYSELPAGTTLEVRGYTGDHWGAALTEAKEVTFANGAYEFPVAQESGIILTLLMEPDMLDGARAVTDEAERKGRPSDMHKNSFAQQNLLPIAELFRCETLATHELSYVAPKAASCTEAGNIAHYICTCGAGFAANEHVNALEQDSWIIPAKGHNIKPAGAWEPYTCANGCGMSEKYFLDALALCAQAGGTITFPDGTVSYNGPLVIPTGVTLDLNGACAESDLIVNNGAAVRNGTILHKTGEDGNTVSLGSNGGYVPVLTSSVGSTDTYTLYSAAAKTGKDVSYFDNGTKYTFGYKFDDAAAYDAAAAAGAERIKFGVNIALQAGGVDADYSFSETSVAKMSEVGTGADDFFKVNLKLTGEQVDDVVATPYIKVKALGFRMEGSASTDYVEPTNVAEVDGVKYTSLVAAAEAANKLTGTTVYLDLIGDEHFKRATTVTFAPNVRIRVQQDVTLSGKLTIDGGSVNHTTNPIVLPAAASEAEGATLTLKGVTVQNVWRDTEYGAAFRVEAYNKVVLDGATVTGCKGGMGVAYLGKNGHIEIRNGSVISGNTSTDDNRAPIYLDSAGCSFVASNSTFSDNTSAGRGSVVCVIGTKSSITGCTFTGNTGAVGTVHVRKASGGTTTFSVTGCTFTDNTTTVTNGAAIYSVDGTTTVTDSTFSGNTRNVYVEGGSVTGVSN